MDISRPAGASLLRLAVTAGLMSIAAACGGSSSPVTPTATAGFASTSGQTVTVVVAGDIGLCGSTGVEATALLVDRLPGLLLLAGDLAYMHGSANDFRRCFDPFWGRFRDRWYAAPGNHEYESPNAGPYFDYFAEAAGADRSGFYTLRVGDWLVLMLNSNIPSQRNTAQWEFVRRELESNRLPCAMAVWHHPLYTSGPNGPNPFMRDMFALLEASGADVVANGHDHLYERFARQNADGRPVERGVRQFTVGTGGAELYRTVGSSINSEARVTQFGVLKLDLQPHGYRWEFVTVTGTVADAGADMCR